ncbi:hypothetical protein D9M68_388350 [compost metagenome]
MSAAGSRTTSSAMISTRAPNTGAASACQTEISKQGGAVWAITSPSPSPSGTTLASMLLSMPVRVTIAPFGTPVEPEVNST